jgi:protoporphyrinogen/coproporphyrinogen III oxidase
VTAVVVIGGGITGLTAAYDLQRRGVRPIVLEASTRAGGLICTDRIDGFTIEAGADSMLAQKPAGIELCKELGLAEQFQHVRPPGGAFVLRGRHLYALPRPSLLGIPSTWSGLAKYDLLPAPARLRMALEPFVPAHRREEAEDESVASFFRRRFGAATVDLIAQPLLGGIHAGHIEDLSMRALFPRLLAAERVHGSVLRAIQREAQSAIRHPASAIHHPPSAIHHPPAATLAPLTTSGFVALRGGMDTLTTALVRSLPPESVRCETPADRIERVAAGWRVTARNQTFDTPAVVVAAPASVATRILTPIDDEAGRLCAQVPYVSTASVALAWRRPAIAHPLSGTGFVVARHHSDVRITACSWVSSKWDARAPEDVALLRAFVGGAHDPDVVDLSDDDLCGVVRRDLGRVLGVSGEPLLARVYRWRHAGAQHTVGHLERLTMLEKRLTAHPGLFVAGSGFRSIGIPDCIAEARTAAAAAATFVAAARG